MAKLFGISRSFWLEVFTAVHSSSFLTTELDNLPAMIAPVLEDIFTLRDGGELATWSGPSLTPQQFVCVARLWCRSVLNPSSHTAAATSFRPG